MLLAIFSFKITMLRSATLPAQPRISYAWSALHPSSALASIPRAGDGVPRSASGGKALRSVDGPRGGPRKRGRKTRRGLRAARTRPAASRAEVYSFLTSSMVKGPSYGGMGPLCRTGWMCLML